MGITNPRPAIRAKERRTIESRIRAAAKESEPKFAVVLSNSGGELSREIVPESDVAKTIANLATNLGAFYDGDRISIEEVI